MHASASPLEALAERANWLGASVEKDAFGRALLAAGLSQATVESWFSDPQVTVDGKKQSLFDTLEDQDSGDVLRIAPTIKP